MSFSDLNEEVLRDMTWPNILLNCPEVASFSNDELKIECFSGDWLSLANELRKKEGNVKFDLILSSETTYSNTACEKLLKIIIDCISENGVALIATKRFYFGVGGGTHEVERVIAAHNKHSPLRRLKVEHLKSYEDGFSNIRDLILLKLIKSS